MDYIVSSILTQIVLAFGGVFLLGFLIHLSSCFFLTYGDKPGRIVFHITSLIGTPIHELSHAIMCIVFGHKIKRISLFTGTTDENEPLGYVEHSYNPKNIFQTVGGFFIEFAPLVGGVSLIVLLMHCLIPSVFKEYFQQLGFIPYLSSDFFSIDTYREIWAFILKLQKIVFAESNYSNVLWWVFIFLSFSIVLHMDLSIDDLKSGVKGFIITCCLIAVFDFACFFIRKDIIAFFNKLLMTWAITSIGFMSIVLVFSLCIALAAFGLGKIKTQIKK